jgi:ParB-like chromosome segregation protein Spo0J
VIAGHGRLLAAKAMGMAEVPTIELVGLTEAQKRAFAWPTTKSRSAPAGISTS